MLATLQSEATLACIDLSCSDPTGLPPPSGEMWGVARERRAFCWDCFVKQPPHSEPEVGAAHRQHPAPAQRLRLQSGDLAHHRLSRIPCRVETGVDPTGGAVDTERGFEAAHGRRRDGDGADG